jgi:hypothetical protein
LLIELLKQTNDLGLDRHIGLNQNTTAASGFDICLHRLGRISSAAVINANGVAPGSKQTCSGSTYAAACTGNEGNPVCH